ncbi:MAG: PorT family protein [Dysgonamonadaceae bacterium]|jgi:hypothetical protein|nr:PorT family protein [Dysgonamonadaceae bacterium]
MKRFCIFHIALLLISGISLQAQKTEFTPEWSFGVNGGITMSKIGFNSQIRVPQDYLMQYSGGLTVRYISENHVGIQGEINYSLRGWAEKIDTLHFNKYSRSVAYIEIPLLTHIYFDMGKRARVIFNLGPQVGFQIGEEELERKIVDESAETGYYAVPVQRKFDYGLKGGAGLEFRTGVGSFILDGNYYFGLSDIFNNSRSDYFQASANRVIGLRMTYLFRL